MTKKEEQLKQDIQESQKEQGKYDKLKIYVSGFVGFLLIAILFFPFIYNGFFCSESLGSRITGNILLYLTVIPMSFLGVGLMFVMHPVLIALIYMAYYSLICWKWCSSRWMFVALLLMYLIYFFFMMKAKNFVAMIFDFADNIGVDDIIKKKSKSKKKNNNTNK